MSLCLPGIPLLNIEALTELMGGAGISIAPTTAAIMDEIKGQAAVLASVDMVANLENAVATGAESGIFAVPSIQAGQIRDISNTITGIDSGFGDTFGEVGTLIEAVTNHHEKIIPTGNLGKFAENFSQISSGVEQAKTGIQAAVTGATEKLTSEFEKISGPFADIIANNDINGVLTDQFKEAGASLETLGNLSLPEGVGNAFSSAKDAVLILVNGGLETAKDAALELTNDLDLENIAEDGAKTILSKVTAGADFDKMRSLLDTPKAILGNGIDIINTAKASAGAVSDIGGQLKLFQDDFGGLENIKELGSTVKEFVYDGLLTDGNINVTFPKGLEKIRKSTKDAIGSIIGGGSGEDGDITYDDVMGSVNGGMDELLQAYSDSLKSISSAVTGGLGEVSDTLKGNLGGAFSTYERLSEQLPGLQSLVNGESGAIREAGNAILDKLISEQGFWDQIGIDNLTDNPLLKSFGAIGGFVDSLTDLAANPAAALRPLLSGATKALHDSAPFEKAMTFKGIEGSNKIGF
jgi:hypothetical protein